MCKMDKVCHYVVMFAVIQVVRIDSRHEYEQEIGGTNCVHTRTYAVTCVPERNCRWQHLLVVLQTYLSARVPALVMRQQPTVHDT